MKNQENSLNSKKDIKHENTNDLKISYNKTIEKLKLKLSNNQKKINDIELRKLANIENIKKNIEKKIKKIKKTEIEKFLKKTMPIIDSLEDILILSNKVDIKEKPLIKGIELTLKSLLNILTKLGVETIGQKNEIFNSEIHDSILTKSSEKVLSNHIIDIHKTGFIFNKILLRKAQVIVSEN